MYAVPSAERLATLLCEAMGIDPDMTRRVILDVNVSSDKYIVAYVEMYGDERLLAIDWRAELAGVDIRPVEAA